MPQTTKSGANPKGPLTKQTFETLQDIGSGTVSSLAKDLGRGIGTEFFKQLLGRERKVSGSLTPGESMNMEAAMSGRYEQEKRLRTQLAHERQMRQDEKKISEKKQQELKVQLSALTSEVGKLAQATQGLSQEVQVAAMSAPVEPGVYHVIFFEKLLEFLQSFRKKIDNASYWLGSYNKRASKRSHQFWGQVKVGGGKRLLSAEDYSQRAAA